MRKEVNELRRRKMKNAPIICAFLLGNLLNSLVTARGPKQKQRCVFFEEDFSSGIDENRWSYAITGYGGGNEEFQSYIKDGDVIGTEKSKGGHYAYWKALPLADLTNPLTGQLYGETFFKTGVLDYKAAYGDCTESSNYGCLRDMGNIPPIASAKLESKMSYMYGKVEIEAKLPRGDWLWPALWLLPENCSVYRWPYCGELDIVELRGNDNLYNTSGYNMGNKIVTSAMHFCHTPTKRFYEHKESGRGKGWVDAYHIYALDWQQKSIEFSVDGDIIMRYDMDADGKLSDYCEDETPWGENDKVLKPFDQPFKLLLNVAVGGRSNFFHPSFTPAKPWHNTGSYKAAINSFYDAKKDWFNTWNGNGELRVKHIIISQERGKTYKYNGVDYTC